jgi:hypothetical protein
VRPNTIRGPRREKNQANVDCWVAAEMPLPNPFGAEMLLLEVYDAAIEQAGSGAVAAGRAVSHPRSVMPGSSAFWHQGEMPFEQWENWPERELSPMYIQSVDLQTSIKLPALAAGLGVSVP